MSDPLLRCLICQQGCHNCPDMNQKAAKYLEVQNDLPISCAWICSACHKKNHHPPSASSRHSDPTPTPAAQPSILTPTVKTEIQIQRENAGNCPLYQLGSCPHGISGNRVHQDTVCLRLHPKRCQRFCRNGPNHKHGCSMLQRCRQCLHLYLDTRGLFW